MAHQDIRDRYEAKYPVIDSLPFGGDPTELNKLESTRKKAAISAAEEERGMHTLKFAEWCAKDEAVRFLPVSEQWTYKGESKTTAELFQIFLNENK